MARPGTRSPAGPGRARRRRRRSRLRGPGYFNRQARAFYAVLAASILVGVAMDFIGVSPIRALYLAAILNGVAAPPLLVLIVLLGRSRDLLGRDRSGLLSQCLVGATAVIMAALSVLAVLP